MFRGMTVFKEPKLETWQRGNRVLSPFEYYDNKVLVYPQEGQVEYSSNIIVRTLQRFIGIDSGMHILEGAKLSLLMKPECSLTKNPPVSFSPNLESVQSQAMIREQSPRKSIALEFNEMVSIKEVARWANSDRCILGIANRGKAFPTALSADPDISKQTHWKSFEIDKTYPALSRLERSLKQKITIAVIDTGIDLRHPEIRPNLWTNDAEANGRPGVDDDDNGYVDDVFGYDFSSRIPDPSHKHSFDHGTHVAGLAAAAGENGFGGRGLMARKVKIMALNVTGKYNGAMTEDIEEAIYYAVKMKANVINISMGGPGKADAIAHAISYAVNHGVMVVSSVGNGGNNLDDEFYFPGNYGVYIPGFIAVGAYEVNTRTMCEVSNYSSRFVEVVAPGCDLNNPKQGLFSTKRGGTYGYRKGTSMASPIVAGAVALYMSWLYTNSYHTESNPMMVEGIFTNHMPKKRELADYVKQGSYFNFAKFLSYMPLKN